MNSLTDKLTDDQIRQFHEEGYVMVPNIFAPSELTKVRCELGDIIDGAAKSLAAEGKIRDIHSGESFETRLTRLLADNPHFVADFYKAVEGPAGGGHSGIEMFRLLTHPRLLDVLASLLGDEIIASSVYRIRPKVPGLGRGVVPWHQDSGYFEAHCDRDLIVTVWIPMVDATVENGCLEVLPRSHRQGILRHFTGGNASFLVIEDNDLPLGSQKPVAVPVPLGGALLMTNLTPHCSTPNYTDVIRWSVDLRYQAPTAPTNAFQLPEDFDAHADPVNIACYPPEGDFVVRSKSDPASVHTYEQYYDRRRLYDDASLPYPDRHWQPVNSSR